MKKIVENDLISIFKETFLIDDNDFIKKLKREDFLRWDSLATVSILASVSNKFSIQISPNEFEKFSSFESIKQLINKKINS